MAIPLKNQMSNNSVSAEEIQEQNTYLASLPLTEVSEEEAYNVAQNWLTLIVHHKGHWAASTDPEIKEMHELTKNNRFLGRFFTIHPMGFLFVPSIKEFSPVKSYSRFSNVEVNYEHGWVNLIRDSMEHDFIIIEKWIQENPGGDIKTLFETDNSACWEELCIDTSEFELELVIDGFGFSNYQTGEVLLSSAWHQRPPYNDDCPDEGCSWSPCYPNENALVGCVAIAGAQTMRHWNWPPYGEGGSPYTDYYSWTYMPDWLEYNSDCDPLPAAQVNALAELCYEVAEAVSMSYGCGSSGAYTYDLEDAYEDHYRYHTNCNVKYRSGYTSTQWYNLLKAEYNKNRPVTYRINGHAIVTDGWEEISSTKYVHANYGWGYDDHIAWYNIDSLPGTGSNEYALFDTYPEQSLGTALSGTYSKLSFPYRYFDQDTSGIATFSSGQYLQSLPGITIKGTGSTGVKIYGSTSYNTRIYTNGDTSTGIIIKDGGIKLSNNGGLCLTPLNYPRYLVISYYSSSTVWLEWEDAIGDEDGFEIWRQVGSGSYSLLGTTSNTYYYDNTVSSGTEYSYKVRAYTTEGSHSDYSNDVTVTTSSL
jgi:hypothetical protein